MKRVQINCTSDHSVPFHTIKPLQGELKDLSAENYLKLKDNILKHGFTSPVHVFEENDELYVLDGHQRLRALTAMEQEGFIIPDVPITKIQAKDRKEAKKILLSLASQYGTLNTDGLFEFIQDLNFTNLKEVADEFSLPSIDFDKLGDEYLKDHTDKKEKKPKICPHCGEQL